MFNKENLRKAMERDFNKDKIYNEIVQKMERGSNVNKVLKYSLIPICFIVIVGGVFIFNNNSNKFHDSPTIDYSMMNENRNIYINRVDGFNNLLDIDGKAEDITLKEISEIYPEIENVNIPSNLKNARNIKMYSRKDLTDDYTTLDGYNAMYVNEDEGNEITKSMEIFMSRTLEEKRRCISIVDNSYKMSSINGTDLTIVSFSDKSIIVNFKYNDIYFDIETMNVAQEELVDVLESIIK